MRDQKKFFELSPGILWTLGGIYSGLKWLSSFFHEDFNNLAPFAQGSFQLWNADHISFLGV